MTLLALALTRRASRRLEYVMLSVVNLRRPTARAGGLRSVLDGITFELAQGREPRHHRSQRRRQVAR